MGRQRLNPMPKYLTVVASTPEDAERRCAEMHRLARLTGGRPVRVDRLREAMTIADRVPPTPRDQWRKMRGEYSKEITPRREACAATVLMDVCRARGDILTTGNATRIVEQARQMLDQTRGISPQCRNIIEEARQIVDMLRRSSLPNDTLIEQECDIIKRAAAIIQGAATISDLDREYVNAVRTLRASGRVH
jgi:hypothetical protein